MNFFPKAGMYLPKMRHKSVFQNSALYGDSKQLKIQDEEEHISTFSSNVRRNVFKRRTALHALCMILRLLFHRK